MASGEGEANERTRLLGVTTTEKADHAANQRQPSSPPSPPSPPPPPPSDGGGTATQPPPFSREQKVLLACLCTGSLMGSSLMAVMIPFFPLEASRRGVSQTVTGAVFSCFAATQLAVYPLTGRLVPWMGVTRSYSAGLLLAAVSTAAFGALPHIADTRTFIAACFVTRVVEALATSFSGTAALTIVANRFQERTNLAVGVTETMAGVGMSLGPAIGGGLYRLGGYGLPFYVLGALLAVTACVTRLFMPPVVGAASQSRRLWPMVRAFVSSAEAWLCCLVLLSVSMNWTALDPGIEPYVFAALGVTPSQLGLYFLVSTGMYCVFSVAWGRLHDRVRNTYLLVVPCLVGDAVGLMLLAPSPLLPLQPARWLLGLGMTVKELSQGGAFIPLFNRMLRACTRAGLESTVQTQAFVSSVFGTVFSVGNVVGPAVGGIIIDHFSFPVMTTALAGFSLLAAAASAVQAVRVHNEPT